MFLLLSFLIKFCRRNQKFKTELNVSANTQETGSEATDGEMITNESTENCVALELNSVSNRLFEANKNETLMNDENNKNETVVDIENKKNEEEVRDKRNEWKEKCDHLDVLLAKLRDTIEENKKQIALFHNPLREVEDIKQDDNCQRERLDESSFLGPTEIPKLTCLLEPGVSEPIFI